VLRGNFASLPWRTSGRSQQIIAAVPHSSCCFSEINALLFSFCPALSKAHAALTPNLTPVQGIQSANMPRPIYSFNSPTEFVRLHTAGTQIEFNYESRKIDEFNKRGFTFRAWCIKSLSLGSGSGRQHWLFLVAPGDKIEGQLPKEGEECKIKIMNKSGKKERSGWWEAQRIDNPCLALGMDADEWQRYAAFKVEVDFKSGEADLVKPILDDNGEQIRKGNLSNLRQMPSVQICFWLSVSEKTMRAELGSVDRLQQFEHKKKPDDEDSEDVPVTAKQHRAFQYLMNFRHSNTDLLNLFDLIPHMVRPLDNKYNLPASIIKAYKSFNEHQKMAYRWLLGGLPCGVGILPGGPGAGKTHWNLVVSCLAQARDLEVKRDDGKVT
jgi:hypothetical protein